MRQTMVLSAYHSDVYWANSVGLHRTMEGGGFAVNGCVGTHWQVPVKSFFLFAKKNDLP
jgi:hypothetical protein